MVNIGPVYPEIICLKLCFKDTNDRFYIFAYIVVFLIFLCGNCKRSFCLVVIYFLHYLFMYFANE